MPHYWPGIAVKSFHCDIKFIKWRKKISRKASLCQLAVEKTNRFSLLDYLICRSSIVVPLEEAQKDTKVCCLFTCLRLSSIRTPSHLFINSLFTSLYDAKLLKINLIHPFTITFITLSTKQTCKKGYIPIVNMQNYVGQVFFLHSFSIELHFICVVLFSRYFLHHYVGL